MTEKIKKINLTRERDVENYFCNEVRKRGTLIEKFHGAIGAPDRIILQGGHTDTVTIFVEFKRRGEDLDPPQLAYFEKLRAIDYPVWVIDCKERADEYLRRLFDGC